MKLVFTIWFFLVFGNAAYANCIAEKIFNQESKVYLGCTVTINHVGLSYGAMEQIEQQCDRYCANFRLLMRFISALAVQNLAWPLNQEQKDIFAQTDSSRHYSRDFFVRWLQQRSIDYTPISYFSRDHNIQRIVFVHRRNETMSDSNSLGSYYFESNAQSDDWVVIENRNSNSFGIDLGGVVNHGNQAIGFFNTRDSNEENKLSESLYKKIENIDTENKDQQCGICFESIVDILEHKKEFIQINCNNGRKGHFFCKECMEKAYHVKKRCPTCRSILNKS